MAFPLRLFSWILAASLFLSPLAKGAAISPQCDSLLLSALDRNTKFSKLIGELESQIFDAYHLPDHFVRGYYARRIEPYLSKPTYQATDEHTVYRGMMISLKELQGILKEGMDLRRVSWTAAGGRGLYFSSSEREALTYIFQSNYSKGDGVGVVFETLKTPEYQLVIDPVLNSTQTIFMLSRSLAPSEIQKVYLFGQYGLESLDQILNRAINRQLRSHREWTDVFQSSPLGR